MSSSTGTEATLFLTDDAATLKRKVMKYAFSGGQDTAELHRKLGGNCARDTAFQYLQYFEPDDARLEEIRAKFTSGEYLCGELKQFLVDRLAVVFADHQRRRAALTDADMTAFYAMERAEPIVLPVPKARDTEPDEADLYARLAAAGIARETAYHDAFSTDEERANLQLRFTGTLCRTHFFRYKVSEGVYHYLMHVARFDDPVDAAAMKKLCKATGLSPKTTRAATAEQKLISLHV